VLVPTATIARAAGAQVSHYKVVEAVAAAREPSRIPTKYKYELLMLRRYAGRLNDTAGIVALSAGAVGVLSVHSPTIGGTRRVGLIRENAPVGCRCRGIPGSTPAAVGAGDPPVRGTLRILDCDGTSPGTRFARLNQCGHEDRDDNTVWMNRFICRIERFSRRKGYNLWEAKRICARQQCQ
jgi:hypothetical protein